MSQERIALVTGANKGIGFEIARQLAEAGVRVFLGSRDTARGRTAADQLAEKGLQVQAIPLDLTNGASIEAEAPSSAQPGDKVTVIVRAQRLEVGKAAGPNRLKGRIAATSYLGGSAIYAIDAQGLKLQANAIIDAHVFREGDTVDVGFAPSDCVLLGEDDRRLT